MKVKGMLLGLLSIIFASQLASAQTEGKTDGNAINWLTIEEAVEMYKTNPKPMLIDVYTDWCHWCKHMMKTTFSDDEVVPYINTNFYPVRFNAETKDSITYFDTIYVNNGIGSRPTHDLAIKLLDGRLSYPSIVYLDRDGNRSVVPGFLKPREILPILVYFTEEINKTTPYPEFEKYFKETYPDNGQGYTMVQSVVKWMSLEEALEKSKTQPKKIFLDVYVDWRIGSTMMFMTTYNNPKIGEYLNENFYPIKFKFFIRICFI